MKLSIVLPSVFPKTLQRAVGNILSVTKGIDYEVVVVSPFEVSGDPRVRWVREETPLGIVAAAALGGAAATGDILVAFCDDALFADNWVDTSLPALLAGEARHPRFCLGLQIADRVLGTVFGIYYPYFPMLRRETMDAAGGYFSREFQSHFTDPDLGLRIWDIGGRCERTEAPVVAFTDRVGDEATSTLSRKGVSLARDTRVFYAKWAGKYGAGWRGDDVDDFNINVDAIAELVVGRDCSIYLNDPVFKTLIDNYLVNAERWNISGPGVARSKSRRA